MSTFTYKPKKKIDYHNLPPNFLNNERFLQSLNNITTDINRNQESQTDINNIYSNLCNTLKVELDIASSNTKNRKVKNGKPFWNDFLEELWQDLRIKQKNFKKCRNRPDRNKLWNLYKSAQHMFDKNFRFYRRKYSKAQMNEIEKLQTNNPKEFWEKISKLGPRRKNVIPMEILNADGTINSNSDMVLLQWKNDFENLYKITDTENFDTDFYERAQYNLEIKENHMLDPLYVSLSDANINENIILSEVEKVVNKAKLGKSCGMDEIPYELWKISCMKSVLQNFFQLCFDSGKIPCDWSKAIITPIPKGGNKDKRVPLNYRGISLLNTSSKLYTSLLNHRLLSHLEQNDVLANEQNGFRPDRSCLDHVYTLTAIIRNRLALKKDTFTAFIDLQKAFDFVDRKLLLIKLLQYNIDAKIYFAIKALLQNTQSCIKLNNHFSEYFGVENGVRQGDPFSTTLFAIFINDLVKELNEVGVGLNITNILLCCLLYADDLVLFAENEKDLKKLLECLYLWCNKWRVKVNITKSNVLHFRHSKKKCSEVDFSLGEQKIEYASSYKYLGIILDEHLTFSKAINELASSANRALGSLISKYKLNKNMGYSTFTKLFNSCILPILTYCCPVWSHVDFSKLIQIQVRAMRMFLGVHKFAATIGVFGDMGWLECKYYVHIECIRLWNRLNEMSMDRLPSVIFNMDYLSTRKNTWCSNMNDMFQLYNLEKYYQAKDICDLNVCKNVVTLKSNEIWKQEVKKKPKLRFYTQFKTELKPEPYVITNLSPVERSHLAQLRLGILPIAVEIGRYRSIPLKDRKCLLCNDGSIEDEKHILFDCSMYNMLRSTWLVNSNFDLKNMKDMNMTDFYSFMSEKARQTAKYVINIMDIRKSKIYMVQS
jgi:hypothetical protein